MVSHAINVAATGYTSKAKTVKEASIKGLRNPNEVNTKIENKLIRILILYLAKTFFISLPYLTQLK
tara:strand:- start:143 stop:340 length:198 start_codon:yes stop_codon:yes gene_type:complete